jgi:hypothetical protein
MKPFLKFFTVVFGIPLVFGVIFFDNIKGYYRFKQYCESEAGFKLYAPVEPNRGWLAPTRSEAMKIAFLNGVSFSRYKDIDSKQYFDVRYVSGKPYDINSFVISPSDESVKTDYRWEYFSKDIFGEKRLSSNGSEVFDGDGKKMFGFYSFSYEKYNRKYLPLDMNPYIICFSSEIGDWYSHDERIALLKSAFSE